MLETKIEVLSQIGVSEWDVFPAEFFVYPSGELNCRIPGLPEGLDGDVIVKAHLRTTDSLVRLMLAGEILHRNFRGETATLIAPYFPYGQQDRVMSRTESFSLRAASQFVGEFRFTSVVCCDPHSDVLPALVDHIHPISQLSLIKQFGWMSNVLSGPNVILVSPDAGAAKKTHAIADHFGCDVLCGAKHRNTRTGEIVSSSLPEAYKAQGKDAVIVDDICVGGKTFVELAKLLKKAGAARIFLYCTHGIFSKGLGVFGGLIDWVLTTDTFCPADAVGSDGVPLLVHRVDYTEALA